MTGIVDFRTELLDENGDPISATNPLPTTGGGGGGGGSLSDTVFVDSLGQLFVYRDTGTGTPNAYAIPAWTLYTPTGTVSSASAGNAAASGTGAAVPGSADYIGFRDDSGNLTGVSGLTPLPVYDAVTQSSQQDMINLLTRMLNYLNAPVGYDKSLQRSRQTTIVESGTITTLTTVTTVATVTNAANIGGIQGQLLVNGQNVSAWQACVRSRIS